MYKVNVKNFNDIQISYSNFLKFIFLILLCVLYAFYEIKIFIQIMFITLFFFYFFTRKSKLTIYALWSVFFISICTLSLLWTDKLDVSLEMLRRMIVLVITGNLVIAFVNSKEKLFFVYKSFVFAGVVLTVKLLITVPFREWGSDRFIFNEMNPNMVGLFLAISAIFAMFLALQKNKKIYYGIILIFSFIVAFTGSRKAFLLLILGLCALYLFNADKVSKKITAPIVIMFIFALSYFLVFNVQTFYESIGYRLENLLNTYLGDGSQDYSTRVRMQLIDVGKSLILNKPLLGYGLATFGYVSGYGIYAHNNYIELLVGIGVIGTIIYYSIFIYTIICLIKNIKMKELSPLLVIIVLLIVMDYGLVSYSGEVYQMLIPIAIAALKLNK